MKLSDMAVISAGQGAPQGESAYGTEGVPFIKAGDLASLLAGKKESEIQHVNESVAKKHRLKIYPAGSILFAKSGMSCMKGYVYKTDSPCYVVSHLAIIIPTGCDGDYLKYYFQFHKPNSLVKDAAYPSISLADIGEMEINLPTQVEQQKIVNELEKVTELIALRKEQLAKLDELVKSRFIELFGDVKKVDKLINLCNFIDYRGKTPEKTESGLPFITAKNVKMHHMSFDTQEFISKETYDKVMTRGFPRIGDVVFTTEAPLGNVCRIPYIETEFYIGQRIITMQTEQLEPAYLEYALSSDDFKRKIAEKSSGSTVTGIRSKLLEQLTIPVPPRAVQKQFTAFVEQTDKSKLAIQESLAELETLKKALMQKYFG